MRRFIKWCMFGSAMLMMLLVTTAAMAQGGGGGDKTRSVFQMFFFPVELEKGLGWADVLGLMIIWGLVLLSMTSTGMAMSLALKYRRSMVLPTETREELEALLSEKKYREAIEYANADNSYLGKVTAAALNEAANGFSAMERSLEETGDAEATKALRPIEYLNVLGNISPMMGLFGTVFGMIVAFQALVASGGQPDPVALAGGISTALVTTFWGLVVAIPALAAYAVIRNRIDAMCAEGMLIAEELISPFKPGHKKPAASAAPAPSSSSSSARTRATPQPQ